MAILLVHQLLSSVSVTLAEQIVQNDVAVARGGTAGISAARLLELIGKTILGEKEARSGCSGTSTTLEHRVQGYFPLSNVQVQTTKPPSSHLTLSIEAFVRKYYLRSSVLDFIINASLGSLSCSLPHGVPSDQQILLLQLLCRALQ